MYTDSMRRAVHSLDSHCPKGFYLDIAEHTHNGTLLFLELIIDEKTIMSLPTNQEKVNAVAYTAKVKKALEAEGAIVQVNRRPMKEG